ncbi:hypothetical protein RRG08_063154 [Elysia crispata]|uniref:Reverse transcriptase domain-containing protein n=1 Tax=Elysia crispata TaxID=231223 RepID=A0AAE0XYX3_9GAST|nr:hypothetical protein RRG08_063154 [Elysia crispata]
MYDVPEDVQVMLDDYFSGFRMRFSTIRYTTDWINLEIKIAMGFTISPILFVMAMKVILKAAEDSAGPANLSGGCYMPPLKAFMDDTTIICSKEDETRRMLEGLDVLMAWCRMKFKPKKSCSLSVRKGLLAINRCGLQSKLKVWCLQFLLIPNLLWPLLAYEICSTTVEAIEAKINKFTRRWLGVPPGLKDVAMYCRKAKLRLPLKSILEEYKCGKARLLSMLEDSKDPIVKTVQPTIKTGRKWKVVEAEDEEGDAKSWHGRPVRTTNQIKCLLDGCDDWDVSADLPEWDSYPSKIKETRLRPDIMIHSASTQQLIMVELTVSYENRMEEVHIYKREKYLNLTKELENAGYKAVVMPVEVGARGFVGSSVYDHLTKLSLCGNKRTKALKLLAEIAENSSRWIWSRRNEVPS